MRVGVLVLSAVVLLPLGVESATDRDWENPVFATLEDAVATAVAESGLGSPGTVSRARDLFLDLTLAEGDLEGRHPSSMITRRVIDDTIVTHLTAFDRDPVQRRTVERFLEAVPRQRRVLEGRLARFGYPEIEGLTYLRLVESVDAFSSLNRASSDRMSRVGGVTYYCRYVVLPLSYVSREGLDELRRSGALSPSVDVEGTVRRWQNESFANLVNTYRHEMVHVRTNTTLGVPTYSNRSAFPTWFHEGTATYLAADPRAGLSVGYQEFQDLFFYLAQRFGIRKLQAFYGRVLGGNPVADTLQEIYALSGSGELQNRSHRWHRSKELIKTAFWILGALIVLAAFRGGEWPYIGFLQLLVGAVLAFSAATGLAEHLYGLRGPEVVLMVKAALWLATAAVGVAGLRRIRRHGRYEAD